MTTAASPTPDIKTTALAVLASGVNVLPIDHRTKRPLSRLLPRGADDNRTIGEISGIKKDGWDYLWVRYEDVEKDFHLVKKPIGVYVERVYARTNFSLMGI